MVRGLGPELGAVLADMHRDHGVDLRTGVHGRGDRGRRRRAGERGAPRRRHRSSTPTSWSSASASCPRRAGSKAPGSRSTTASCATRRASPRRASSRPATSPAGRTRCSTAQLMRLEHWTNATEQGVHAARRLLGRRREPFAPVPFVWSDQYDRKIQTVGVVSADAEVHVAHGSLAERQFVALFGRDGPPRRRARLQPPALRHAVPPHHRRARLVGRRAAAREPMTQGPARGRRAIVARARRAGGCSRRGSCSWSRAGSATSSRSRCSRRCCPHYVEDSLGTGSVAVGIAVGAFAVGAIAAAAVRGPHRRPDRPARARSSAARSSSARRPWCTGSSTRCGGSILLRVVTGFGEAGFFVGAATMITDLSPVDRRGEAVCYWSVAVYGGLSFGPVLGSSSCAARRATR